jgi:hypothetical protein
LKIKELSQHTYCMVTELGGGGDAWKILQSRLALTKKTYNKTGWDQFQDCCKLVDSSDNIVKIVTIVKIGKIGKIGKIVKKISWKRQNKKIVQMWKVFCLIKFYG